MDSKLDTNSGGKKIADGTLVMLALADLQPFSKHPYKEQFNCFLHCSGSISYILTPHIQL